MDCSSSISPKQPMLLLFRRFILMKSHVLKNALFRKKIDNFQVFYFHGGGSNEYSQPIFYSRKEIDDVLKNTFNICFRAEIRKNYLYPCKPHFFYVKSFLPGCSLHRLVFLMFYLDKSMTHDFIYSLPVSKKMLCLLATCNPSGYCLQNI